MQIWFEKCGETPEVEEGAVLKKVDGERPTQGKEETP